MVDTTELTVDPARRDEIADALSATRDRIANACKAVGRDPASVTLVAVTKFFPAADALALVQLGVTDLGESRDQEAAAKAQVIASAVDVQPRWHFVGQLQTNKARSVAGYADVVHSVDRPALADALAAGVRRVGRAPLGVLLQVNLDPEQPGVDGPRGGVSPDRVPELADQVAEHEELRLLGVMAVAPRSSAAEPAFARLAEVATGMRARHPTAELVSAGMSADLEAAVAQGATHVRIGTALLGRRSPEVR